MKEFLVTIFYEPLYNGLIFLMDLLPWADAGVIVILFTVIIKLILFPLSQKAVKTQMQMKAVQKDLDQIKEEYKNNREKQARAMMDLYKSNNINPFSSILLILIQIPIIITLYWIFLKGGLPEINTDLLYSFVAVPEIVNMNFLGLVDIGGRSAVLAFIAALTQYFQVRYAMPPLKPRSEKDGFKEDLARGMNIQMRYVMPIIVFFIGYSISGAVTLYWATSNLFAVGQELYVRRKFGNRHAESQTSQPVLNKNK